MRNVQKKKAKPKAANEKKIEGTVFFSWRDGLLVRQASQTGLPGAVRLIAQDVRVDLV
jgi:hypothetical protein